MNTFNPEKEIKISNQKCIDIDLNPELSAPTRILNQDKLKKQLHKNSFLVSLFKKEVNNIKKYLPDCLFLLVDRDMIILDIITENNGISKLKPGFSLDEKNAGTNAVCLAKKLKSPVYIKPDQNYCKFLEKMYCFTEPLILENNLNGFINISTISKPIKKESIAIVKLLKKYLLKEYKSKKEQQQHKDILLNSKQTLILKCLARGMTAREISREIHLSTSTIKYHKKNLYKKLNANSVGTALLKAVKYDLIPLDIVD